MNIKGVLTIEKPPKNHLKSDIFKNQIGARRHLDCPRLNDSFLRWVLPKMITRFYEQYRQSQAYAMVRPIWSYKLCFKGLAWYLQGRIMVVGL